MSYSLGDKNGPVLHLASVGGMNDLLDFLNRFRENSLSSFLTSGVTSAIPEVIEDITMIAPYATNPDVKSTLENLKDGLSKVKGTAVIFD